MVCGRSNQIWPLPSHELETETKSSEDADNDDEEGNLVMMNNFPI